MPMNPIAIALSSLIVPGLGQFLLNKRERGLFIFLTAGVSAFLVNWSFVHQNIGKFEFGGIITSWLWLPVILFWLWNALDARALRVDQRFSIFPGIVFIAIVFYVIAWNVTDVKLNRLVERFNDARSVAANLLNPDLITISINGQDEICAWKCLYTYTSDKMAGRTPAGLIRVSDNLLDIVGRMKILPASKWQVSLGLAQPGEKVNTFVAGTMVETIAMGLMATIFSTIIAVPLSFLAAHNIMSRIPGGSVLYYIMRDIIL